jgi:hypothetical protein
MKTAILSNPQPIKVLITKMRFSLVRDMFDQDGVKLCEIQYELLAEKYLKLAPVETPQEDGSTVTTQEEQEFAFLTPVLFDTAKFTIPYEFYLLIESYRVDPTSEKLAMINAGLEQFPFQHSLEGFVLNVTSIA